MTGWLGAHRERQVQAAAERERVRHVGRAERGPNLEEVTLATALSEVEQGSAPCAAQWNVKVTAYPDGVAVSAWRRPNAELSTSCAAAVESSQESSCSSETETEKSRYDSSIRRSKRLLAHRARCMGVHSLWTFTKRGKFSSADHLWHAWALFRKRMRRRYPQGWNFVAVPELHSDGETWHLHVAFDRWVWVGTLRRFWYQALGGAGDETGDATPGSVNVKSVKRGHSNARRVSSYIAAYVGKGFERGGSNRRVFAASVGLHPIGVSRWHGPFESGPTEMAFAVGKWLYQHHGVERGDAWFYSRGPVEGFIFTPK